MIWFRIRKHRHSYPPVHVRRVLVMNYDTPEIVPEPTPEPTPVPTSVPELSYDRHIIMYAKGHYEPRSLWDDLAVLVGERNALHPEQVSKNDILVTLMDVALPHIVPSTSDYGKLTSFLLKLHPDAAFEHWEKNTPYEERLVRSLLSALRFISVQKNGKVIINLGEADPMLLPLKIERPYNPNARKEVEEALEILGDLT